MKYALNSHDGPPCEVAQSYIHGLPAGLKQWANDGDEKIDQSLRYKCLAILYLRMLGWSAPEIAKAMKMTRRNVYYLIKRSKQKISEDFDSKIF